MTQKGPLRYSKTCVKLPLSKRPKIGFQDQLKINAGEKYCRMLKEEQGEHSAILCTVIEIPFVIKIFVVPRLFEEKQGDIVHIHHSILLSFLPPLSSRYLVYATPPTVVLLPFFKTLCVFRSWPEDVHIVRI